MSHTSLAGAMCGLIMTGVSVNSSSAEVISDHHWVEVGSHAPASPDVGGHFGTDVDTFDDVVIVGAAYQGADPFNPAGPGFAQINRLQSSGHRAAPFTITAPDGEDGDLFGLRVALGPILGAPPESTIALISAPRRTSLVGDLQSGAVYNFRPDLLGGVAWQQTITPSDPSYGQMFGVGMDFDGRTLAVGAPRDSAKAPIAGCVYLYSIDRDGLAVDEVRLDPGHPDANQFFGFSVDIDGDRLAVGAFADSLDAPIAGAVYVFDRQADGTWEQTARVTPDELLGDDFFGTAVAMQGDVLIASSDNRRVDGLPSVGRVYVFQKSGDQWVQTQTLDPPIIASGVYWGACP